MNVDWLLNVDKYKNIKIVEIVSTKHIHIQSKVNGQLTRPLSLRVRIISGKDLIAKFIFFCRLYKYRWSSPIAKRKDFRVIVFMDRRRAGFTFHGICCVVPSNNFRYANYAIGTFHVRINRENKYFSRNNWLYVHIEFLKQSFQCEHQLHKCNCLREILTCVNGTIRSFPSRMRRQQWTIVECMMCFAR